MDAADTEISLSQYWYILKRRWLPASVIFFGTLLLVSFWGARQTPIYEAEGKLRFKGQDSTSALTGLGDELGQLESLDRAESPIATEIGIMQTVPIIQQTIDNLEFKNAEGELLKPKQFLSRLDVSHERGTDILKVVYQSPQPEKAKMAVDALMAVYLEAHLLANRAEASAARLFIEKQLPNAEQNARQAEAALRRFKEENQVIALDKEASATVNFLESIQTKMTDISARIADTEAQFTTLSSRLGRNPQAALVATAVSQSSGVQQVLADYQQVEANLASERVRFHEQHPVIVDLKTKQASLDSLLRQRISNVLGAQSDSTDINPSQLNLQVGAVEANLISDYIRLDAQLRGLTDQTEALRQTEASYRQRAALLPQLEQSQRELERRLDAAQSTYSLLLERLQEVQLAENQNVGNVRIIQPAEVLDGSVSPRAKLYIVTGGMLGSLLAAAAMLLLEALDRSIKTVDEASAALDLPVLGVIPNFTHVAQPNRPSIGQRTRPIPSLVACTKMPSPASESYHMLGNNLKFLDSDHPPRIVAITSSVALEGKSMVASNLAASLSQTGQRVLLIDGDLHHPIQHWIWDYPNKQGLSNLLVGQVSVEDAIIESLPNLHLLLAGVVPPNPAALLDSQRMIDLIQLFKAQYDYVIIDTPALIGSVSAAIIEKMADGMLLVVRPKVADTTSVNYVRRLIEQSQQRVLGLVVNGTLPRYEPHSQYLSDEFYMSLNPISTREGEERNLKSMINR
ncbi:MAG: polysaccharide biosynthesis tyrosine autokinase [Cyanobacteria bacterium P01_F01_bin.150]